MSAPLVGIIANPASGRDIRRLVAHGTGGEVKNDAHFELEFVGC